MNKLPIFDVSSIILVLDQSNTLNTGLLRIHNCTNTVYENQILNRPIQTQVDNPNHLSSRHGDIKPENILWTGEEISYRTDINIREHGILVIADFGLMAFHRGISWSVMKGGEMACTPAYAPPECQLNCKFSRAYDMWSLGCVYPEFVTWLLYGWAGLEEFSTRRRKTEVVTDSGCEISDEGSLYTLICNKEGRPKNAILSGNVRYWIMELHQKPRCSEFIAEFLHLIENKMLQVNPRERIGLKMLNADLCRMAAVGKQNEDYFTKSKHCTPKSHERHMREIKEIPPMFKLSPRPNIGSPLLRYY